MRDVPPRARNSGRATEAAVIPRSSASTITWKATTSLRAANRRMARPSQAEFRARKGWSRVSRATFSPSVVAQTARRPAAAGCGAARRITVRRQ